MKTIKQITSFTKIKSIMKAMKYFFGIVALSVLTVVGVKAQTPQIVTQGSIHHYHVTDHSSAGYTYSWTLDAPVAGNIVETPNAAGTNITWGTAGTYTINLTETNSAGSCSTTNTFQVTVLGTPHLQFANTTSASCADQVQYLALTFTDANGQPPAAGYYPLVVNHTVNGTARSATFNSGDPLQITLSAADRADQDAFANYTIAVVITSATSNGGTVTLDANTSNTNTVYDIPEINPIVAD